MNGAKESPFPVMGVVFDVARRIERPESLRAAIEGLDGCGYNVCMLHLMDAYDYPRHPGIGRKHAYSVDTMQDIQRTCQRLGMEIIPVIHALGHCGYITNKQGYAAYDEGRGTDRILGCVSPSFPETYELLQELFEDWCHHVPGSYLHVGLDESPEMGQYAARTSGEGAVDHVQMFADHCNRLNAIVKGLGRRMIMWGDMFYYYPQAMERVDKDIIVADWYYYAFTDTPTVEMFNFAPIDSSGQLKAAGFEVWGTSSVWPNLPFPDVGERWQNFADWIRYGKSRGIDGILNADWENSEGFCDTSAFLFRAFGKSLCKGGDIEEALAAELRETTGLPESAHLVPDILRLGDYHLTGHQNRHVLTQPLAALTAKARESESQRKCEAIGLLLAELPELLARPEITPEGKRLLHTLALDHELLALVWRLRGELPGTYEALCDLAAGQTRTTTVAQTWANLAESVDAFACRYAAHWNETRFPDDDPPVLRWAENTVKTLKEWIRSLEEDGAAKHPLYRLPRLECVLRCQHPAMQIAPIGIHWSGERLQKQQEVMTRFESAFSTPTIAWEQYPCVPLEHDELPERLVFSVSHYGQMGIAGVTCMWKGRTYPFVCSSHSGEHVEMTNGVVWLGPQGAAADDPTTRTQRDEAVWTRKLS